MMNKNFWIAVVVGSIVVNVIDFLVQGMLFQQMFYSKMQGLKMTNPAWFMIMDVILVIVFVWFYDKVYGSFGGGMNGGMKFGLYYGVVMSFPTMFFPYLMWESVMYGYVWASIIYGIAWGVVLGTVVGKFYMKGEATPAA
ncbi:MAG: hypothetical protein HYV29_07445 [Ignavibacteriales bacterium]|nr:hypothetical protein [Ignavibacteriales bacterium]